MNRIQVAEALVKIAGDMAKSKETKCKSCKKVFTNKDRKDYRAQGGEGRQKLCTKCAQDPEIISKYPD